MITKFLAKRAVKHTIQALEAKGKKPTIIRERCGLSMWGVTETKFFTRIDSGYKVEYYTKGASPFHNLYRIVSKPTDDFVIHKVVR